MTTVANDAPQALDAEKALIGSIFINPDTLRDVAAIVSAEDFFLLRHRQIWAQICALAARNEPVDAWSLAEALDDARQLESVGGRSYLVELGNSTPTFIYAEYYAQLVERAAARRRLLKAADDMRALAMDTAEDVGVVLAKAGALLDGVTSTRPALIEAEALESVIDRQYSEIEAFAEDGVVAQDMLKSSFVAARHTLDGYVLNGLYTFGARPGVGKSSIMVAEAVGIAQRLRHDGEGKHVRIYSLEMTNRQVGDAIAAAYTRTPYKQIRTRQVSGEALTGYIGNVGRMAQLPIYLHDRLRMLEDIEADIRREARGGKLAIAFIDYVQLVNTRAQFKGESAKRLRIGHITATLKDLATELNVPIVIAAQLRRGGVGEPTMEMLKEAGNIEEDSDGVLLLHRDMDAAKGLAPNEIQKTTVIMDKNRHGAAGRFELGFDGARKTYVDLAMPQGVR